MRGGGGEGEEEGGGGGRRRKRRGESLKDEKKEPANTKTDRSAPECLSQNSQSLLG